jgi:hypothetical protein
MYTFASCPFCFNQRLVTALRKVSLTYEYLYVCIFQKVILATNNNNYNFNICPLFQVSNNRLQVPPEFSNVRNIVKDVTKAIW